MSVVFSNFISQSDQELRKQMQFNIIFLPNKMIKKYLIPLPLSSKNVVPAANEKRKLSEDSECKPQNETAPSTTSASAAKKSKVDIPSIIEFGSNKLGPMSTNKVDTDFESIDFSCTRTCANGEKTNFKISSWNVAGFRACIKKNALKYVRKEDADIVCLQEIKCQADKLPPEANITGYFRYLELGKKAGYAGVALYSKIKPNNVQYGLGNHEYDSEGRLITAEYDKFFVVTAYVPNSGSDLKNLSKRLRWDNELRKLLKSLDEKKPVILAGDLNVCHQEIDIANPKSNIRNPGFTKEERDGMTALLKDNSFTDSFRRLYPEKTGSYSWWSYTGNARSRNIGWRLDYFVLSDRLFNNVCDSVIRSEVYGSDHCPVVLYLNI